MAKSKLESLAGKYTRKERVNWRTRLGARRKEMDELISQWKAGACRDKLPYAMDMAKLIKDEFKPQAGVQMIVKYIRGEDGEAR